MSSILAGLVILLIGDSHMVHEGGLIDLLPPALEADGARVYAFGACGATPTDYLTPKTSDCGIASRAAGGPVKRSLVAGQPVWNARDLIAQVKPNMVFVVMGDTIGAYKMASLPKPWVWDQVTALTGEIRAANLGCDWIGPPWGTASAAFGKTDGRVAELSAYLAQVVGPCRYVDSTVFAKPGQWRSIDGQHLDAASYKAWAAAIRKAVETQAPAAAPAGAAPAMGAEPW